MNRPVLSPSHRRRLMTTSLCCVSLVLLSLVSCVAEDETVAVDFVSSTVVAELERADSNQRMCKGPALLFTISGFRQERDQGIHTWGQGVAPEANNEIYDGRIDQHATEYDLLFSNPDGQAADINSKVEAYTTANGGCRCMVVVAHSWGAILLHRAAKRYGTPACAQYIYVDPPNRQFSPPGDWNTTPDAINNAHDGGIMSDPNLIDWTGGDASNLLHDSFVESRELTQEQKRKRLENLKKVKDKVLALADGCGSKKCEKTSGCAQ